MEYHIIKKGIESELAKKLFFNLELFLVDLAFEYPFFKEWLKGVFDELISTDQRIIVLCCGSSKFDIKGVSILKKTRDEKKICTLRVDKSYRNQGIGSVLLRRSIEILEENKPLITVSGIHMKEFSPFLKKHGFVLKDKVKSLYRRGSYEYFFNVPYKHKFVLISIKPEYASAIAKGWKKVEFRKRVFSDTVERAFVYSSSPVKKIIGSFRITHIEKGTPEYIWNKYSECGSISEYNFFDYFQNHKLAFGIEISSFDLYDNPIDPYCIDTKFRPPQSFCYIDNVEIIKQLFDEVKHL